MDALYPTHCDECGALIGYMGAHPRGYMICESCNDKRGEPKASESDGRL